MKKKLIASFGERIKSILQMSEEVTAADNQRHDDDAAMNNGHIDLHWSTNNEGSPSSTTD